MTQTGKTDYHIPVMLHESIEGLEIKPDGVYVDATFGGGGHTSLILSQLKSKGRLIAFDRDADALENIPQDKNFTLVNADFIFLKNFIDYLGIEKVDGILADLGISSHQIDEPERGFSFRYDAPLDMRMDKQNPVSARTILNERDAGNLQDIFSRYGEVKNARTLAKAIVERRTGAGMETTGDLVKVAEDILPARENIKKYLAPVFQALRIEVNDELNGLEKFLRQCYDVLDKGGRLVVITYHSLEDRIVKNFLAEEMDNADEQSKLIYGGKNNKWEAVHKKPAVPTAEEIERNPRARSAKLRVAIKR